MFQKHLLISILFLFVFSCNADLSESEELTTALEETRMIKKYSEKELIDDKFDDLLAKELERQQELNPQNIILKSIIFDKTLIVFPIDKSKRLDYHINKLNNEEAVSVGLHDNFHDFENCKFNRELNLAKFYFDKPISDATETKFFKMCILPDFQIVEL